MNPLLIDSIIPEVFRFIPTQYLNNCRLVCKQWHKEAEQTKLDRHAIILDSPESNAKVWDRLESDSTDLWISDCEIRDSSLDDLDLQEIISKIASGLRSLNIHDVTGTEETLHELIRSIPNLTKLLLGETKTKDGIPHQKCPIMIKGDRKKEMIFPKVKSLDVISFNQDKFMRTLLSSIIRAFPNLDVLVAIDMFPENPDLFHNLRLPHLTSLTFHIKASGGNSHGPSAYGITNEHLQCLINMKLSLKKLILVTIHQNTKPELLKKFIESQTELTRLELVQKNDAECNFNICPFPMTLPKLTSLLVGRPFVKSIGSILTSFPNLKTAGFDFEKWDKWDRVLPKNPPPQHNLEEVTFRWIDEKSLFKLSQTFTTLNCLKIQNCDDKHLRVIFEHFTQLTTLDLTDNEEENGPRITDEGITGIPSNSMTSGVIHEETRKWSYIGNMNALKTLRIKLCHDGISENSFWYGVLQVLPQLDNFYFKGIKLSPKIFEAVTKHFHFLKYPRVPDDVLEWDCVLQQGRIIFIGNKL